MSSILNTKLNIRPATMAVPYDSKTYVKRPLSKRPQVFFKTIYRLMQVKSITECSNWSILQYFRPSLSYNLSLRSLFCLFLSGRFTQVLLFIGVRTKVDTCCAHGIYLRCTIDYYSLVVLYTSSSLLVHFKLKLTLAVHMVFTGGAQFTFIL